MGDLKEKKLKNPGHSSFAMLNDEILENVAFDTARQFFTICDRDSKGYLLKGDMQRLRESGLCNLSIEELEMVFDSLDEDHNGILTMEEFIFGFGEFVKSTHPEMVELTEDESEQTSSQQLQCITNTDEDVAEREKFQTFLRQIGAEDLFADENTEQLWQILRNDNPNVLNKFEAFLKNLSSEMKSVRDKMCATTQNKREDLNRLYTDVEQQIKQETERCLKNEQEKMQKLQWSLENEIESKNLQLQELSEKFSMAQTKMENMEYDKEKSRVLLEKIRKAKKISFPTYTPIHMKLFPLLIEKDALAEQKQNLEMQLCKQKDESEELMKYLNKVQKEIREERKRRAKAALTVNDEAVLEREELIKQLNALRAENMRLLDELDENTVFEKRKKNISKKYISAKMCFSLFCRICLKLRRFQLLRAHPRLTCDRSEKLLPCKHARSSPMLATAADYRTSFNCRSRFLIDSDGDDLESIHSELLQADSGISGLDNFENGQDSIEPINVGTPDRVFKVVVAGDSGVGKTCFLDRLCNNRFNPGIRSTIGIDFHMKILKVEDQLIALQLWDTAGQERFRSITKQYFRKADAVILMFDLVSVSSFTSVREWITGIRAAVEEDCVVCIIGNKTDLVQEGKQAVKIYKEDFSPETDGESLYFETSAKSGDSVHAAMYQLALVLKDVSSRRDEKLICLQKTSDKPKSKCCSRTNV
ncbi:Ras and EF-hand domain-containing protein [Trichinella nelsoni]|uniref:Ras and EF-hand domain-containing protein n=1 Tax=Trichinella nelsoni TaxID=6336 RepID=A0A0V0RKW3_9BILA|nr:Ras and EF-hand domain-containing protein [Trichinella nelsoni]